MIRYWTCLNTWHAADFLIIITFGYYVYIWFSCMWRSSRTTIFLSMAAMVMGNMIYNTYQCILCSGLVKATTLALIIGVKNLLQVTCLNMFNIGLFSLIFNWDGCRRTYVYHTIESYINIVFRVTKRAGSRNDCLVVTEVFDGFSITKWTSLRSYASHLNTFLNVHSYQSNETTSMK